MSPGYSDRSSDRYSTRVDYSYLDAPEFLGKTAVSADDYLQKVPSARSPALRAARPKRIDTLRNLISDRDHQTLALLKKYRLANSTQIQRQIFTQHTSIASARRTTTRCLNRLADHGLVDALGRRVGGIKAGSSGIVWNLTPTGHRLLDPTKRKVRYEPSIHHITHTLAITELATALIEHASGRDLELTITTEPDCWRRYRTSSDVAGHLKPDLHVTIADSDTELSWFIEVDRGTESGTVLSRKLTTYTEYFRTGDEQGRTGVFPKTLWIAPDVRRAEFIQERIGNSSGVEPALFAVTTADSALAVLTDFEEPNL